ncbi:MAG: hypothetical protein HY769_00875 [Candidatus Stahlbacteria bacterium]|nr:hypothetical protein [Candidatus Stahlbacteria bacterium]
MVEKIPISFRKEVSEIPSTTYGTFAIYKYPAKFIPQVIAFVIKKYAKPGMKIFDPFAGYGTVGVVSKAYGYNYIMWDLNPIINLIHDVATIDEIKLNVSVLLKDIRDSQKKFIPEWSNLDYWFPKEFLPMLSKAWGYVYSLPKKQHQVLLIPLLKVTRYFSYSDEKVHKLYKSKHSKEKVNNLLKNDWREEFYRRLGKEINLLVKRVEEYSHLNHKQVESTIESGKDIFDLKLNQKVDILVTSPPYLQAQEYIRSTKLELFWLGYKENQIKGLSKKEIPYRQVERIKIYSPTYHIYRDKIKEPHLIELYERYFHSILKIFTDLGENVKRYMCIFVGPAKIRNFSIPIDDIVIEHLQKFGWNHRVTYIDTIVSRNMFQSKINPASGLEDERIKTENLVVLERIN